MQLHSTSKYCIDGHNLGLYSEPMDMNETFADRLLRLREARNLTQQNIADIAGVSYQAVQGWENGASMPRGEKRQKRVADALGVTPGELLYGTRPESPTRSAMDAMLQPVARWEDEERDCLFLPQLMVDVAESGRAEWRVDASAGTHPFARGWAARYGIDASRCAVFPAPDSSMEPRLLPGDCVVIDYTRGDRITDGKIYAIGLNGEVFIKRLFKEIGGGVVIVSDNQDKIRFPDKIIPSHKLDYLQVIGLAVAVVGGV
ncbi:XRE family transcriptional regulator [Chromobacterium subtsugae]|uniref:XRE family transcriptional regulator n=1 Tax=Chromobacterium subtsugae TaxID=251747 RepID=UPI0006417B07|nr:LexA family transcriptional regulator [Chromobacterium subtsugae]